ESNLGLDVPDADEALRVSERKGLQEDRPHGAEDRRVRADPERQREDDRGGESRGLDEASGGGADVEEDLAQEIPRTRADSMGSLIRFGAFRRDRRAPRGSPEASTPSARRKRGTR